MFFLCSFIAFRWPEDIDDETWKYVLRLIREGMGFPAMMNDANYMKALIETYYRKGGMEIQVSAVSRETLLDAQKNPDRHGDLIVRVSGFSAYFTSLSLVTQNEIIDRTEN